MAGKHPGWRPRGGPAAALEPAGPWPPSPSHKKGAPPLPRWLRHPAQARRFWIGGALLAAALVVWIARAAAHHGQTGGSWALMALSNEVDQHKPADNATAGPVYVEFTAPGLYLPLRDALDLELPPQAAEQPLLELLPSAGELAAAARASPRPTLEQYFKEEAERERQQQQAEMQQEAEQERVNLQMAAARWGERRRARPGGQGVGGLGQQQGGGAAGAAAALAAGGQGEGPEQLQDRSQRAEQAMAAAALGGEERPRQLPLPLPLPPQLGLQAGGEGQGLTGQVAAGARPAAAGAEAGVQQQGRKLLAGSGGKVSQGVEEEGGAVRLLIGVTSACCTQKAYRRRQAVRATWGALAAQYQGAASVAVRFMLAQPDSKEQLEQWLPQLEEEVLQHNGTVIMRGADTYRTLPNKTLRLLRYAAAAPARYTHLLKTDDDCYVRLQQLLKALEQPPPPLPEPTEAELAAAQAVRAAAGAEWGDAARARQRQLIYSDGLSAYSLKEIVEKMGPDRWLDDAQGNAFTVEQLAKFSRTGVHPWGRGRGVIGAAAAAVLRRHAFLHQGKARMTKVYLGAIENKGGFWPIRDRASKWYMSQEVLPNSVVPYGVQYVAGWGYLLSRDLVEHAVKKVNYWQAHPEVAPAWFKPMDFEDVLVGLLLMDAVGKPEDHAGFRAAWRACPSSTAVVHMDVDAPALMAGLYEQDVSGLWEKKTVQCRSGSFMPGDYSSWKRWRDALADVERL